MSTTFQTINDQKYSFIDVELRDDVLKSGRKKIVFVEGYDDKIIFEILFEEYLTSVSFIDVSLEVAKRIIDPNINGTGGCEEVKKLLEKFVSCLPREKRFYGVIDRDLNTDEEIEVVISENCYDKRLFIFTERYTIENFFVDIEVLYDFVKDQSACYKKLITVASLKKQDFQSQIITPIESLLSDIGAGNVTIKYFNSLIQKKEKHLKRTIKPQEIENEVIEKFKNRFPEIDIKEKLQFYKEFINESSSNIQKFANAKEYFDFNFGEKIKELCGIGLYINHNKPHLARILKTKGLSNDFQEFIALVLMSRVSDSSSE